MYLAQFMGLFKMALIVCILTGTSIFSMLGLGAPPAWYENLTQNKLYACLMIFFLSNAIEGQLISTGAFEVWFNDVPLWSKIQVGRIPNPPELFQIIDNQLRLQTPGLNLGDSFPS
jgi:selT/selW/selH-like putative selenoprotein